MLMIEMTIKIIVFNTLQEERLVTLAFWEQGVDK